MYVVLAPNYLISHTITLIKKNLLTNYHLNMLSQKKAMSKALPPFTPDERQCLILGNFDYSLIRWGARVDEAGN